VVSPQPLPTTALPEAEARQPRLTRLQLGLIIGAGALIFVLLVTGSVFAGISAGRKAALGNVPAPHVTNTARAVPATEVQPTAIPTCSLDTLASAPGLIKLYGSVVETASGNSLYSNNDSTAVRPAAVLKVLTAAAAVAELGPTFQITTSVDAGEPGTLTLVGQGDATLSATGHSVYAGAPSLATLASQALTAYDNGPNGSTPITHVVLDSSYWDPSDNWDSSVSRTLQTSGYLSLTTALQVDGDRQNPAVQVSPRSNDPVAAAGKAFVAALAALPSGPQVSDVTVTDGQAENGATVLASVQSQPVSTLVKQMLVQNDDTLAEMLARIVSVKETLGGSGSSVGQAILTALAKYSIDTSGLTIEDGSGESDESLITPVFMSKFMSLVSQKANGLQYVAAGIPQVGKYNAKTGSISSAYTISGFTTAADGTGESFTFFAEGPGITSAASPALTALANAVYTCGKNITNN
jgi:D-alanyl-D-alanine carboxypeptidase/D-alanyl-D-alanine-endopeptidase (penicillin-binding protein 4)